VTGQAGHRLLLVNAPPAPHRGEDNARPVPFELPSVPENPRHNIIPSELCNSRRHRQCPASRERQQHTPSPAKKAYRAPDYTIRIMLRSSVLPSRGQIPPVRSARRQERSFAPGPSPALARRKTPHFAGPRPQSARPYQGRRERAPSSLAPPFSSCRRVQHSCGSARCQRSCVGQGPPHHLRPRSSKVRLRRGSTCLLFLQALCHFCSALGPRCASGRARQKRHRAFRAGRKQPSAFAPGCWRRGCRPAPAHSVRQPLRPSARDLSLGLRPLLQSLAPVLRHCLPPSHAARHPLRRRLGARPDGQERLTFDPAVGRSGPGPGESLPAHNVGLFRCSREPCVSLPRRSRARRPPRCQTLSGATLHSLRSFRALGHWETLSRASARPASRKGTTSHASPTRLRDSQQPRPTRKLTPRPQCQIDRHHPPEREEKGINIYNGRQRLTPLQVLVSARVQQFKILCNLLKINLLFSFIITILYMDLKLVPAMLTLIDFIRNVEDEIFEKVQYYTRHQDTIDGCSDIWVHQLNGKVLFDTCPSKPGFARRSVYMLCDLNKDLKRTPDKKAIKKWIEEEVLLHPSALRKSRVHFP